MLIYKIRHWKLLLDGSTLFLSFRCDGQIGDAQHFLQDLVVHVSEGQLGQVAQRFLITRCFLLGFLTISSSATRFAFSIEEGGETSTFCLSCSISFLTH